MYNLPYYKESKEQVVYDFIEQNPFAYLSGCDAQNRPVATQVPVFIEQEADKKVLRGHMMKNTDHHKAFEQNGHVLTIFSGKHCYVSGSWYSNPHIASTWNYMSVHVKGNIRFLGASGLEQVLRKTTLYFENNNVDSPTVFDNLPEEFKAKYMGAIVAFEIEIEEMDHVFKLSQDRDEESYHNIIAKLKTKGADEQFIASEMEKRSKELFEKK